MPNSTSLPTLSIVDEIGRLELESFMAVNKLCPITETFCDHYSSKCGEAFGYCAKRDYMA